MVEHLKVMAALSVEPAYASLAEVFTSFPQFTYWVGGAFGRAPKGPILAPRGGGG
jgi:hypothetical protein